MRMPRLGGSVTWGEWYWDGGMDWWLFDHGSPEDYILVRNWDGFIDAARERSISIGISPSSDEAVRADAQAQVNAALRMSGCLDAGLL